MECKREQERSDYKRISSFQRNPNLPVESLTVPFNGRILPAVRLSDHASFWNKGYRAVMVTDPAFFRNPYYHRQSDTMQTLDFWFMAELVPGLVDFFQKASCSCILPPSHCPSEMESAAQVVSTRKLILSVL